MAESMSLPQSPRKVAQKLVREQGFGPIPADADRSGPCVGPSSAEFDRSWLLWGKHVANIGKT